MSDVRSRVARGAAWMVAARVVDQSLGLVSTLVLARLLVPDDFGLVAMAMSVVALLDLIRTFGFDVVLIQHPSPERVHYDTAWTVNILVSAGVSVVLAALAWPSALFFREPAVMPVMLVLSISPLVSAFANVGIVDFRKQLQFDRDFLFMLYARLTRFSVTIPLAFLLRSHWALVAGIVVGRCAEVALSYAMHRYRPRLSLGEWRALYHFSKWLVVKNILQLLTQRSSDFVIGRIGGMRALGLFNVSYEIAYLPSSELAAPINRAILPGYAKQARDRDALRRGLLEVVGVIAFIILPAGAGLMATASYVVPVLLGDAWLEAIPILPVLALYGLLMAVGSNTGSLFLAIGKPRIVSFMATFHLAVLLPCLVFGVWDAGVLGGAWAFAISAAVAVPVGYGILMHELHLRLMDLLERLWRPLVGVGVMVGAVQLAAARLPEAVGTLQLALELGVLASLGAACYFAVVFASWWVSGRPDGAERYVVDLARSRLGALGWLRAG